MKIHQMLLFPLEGSGSGVYVDKLAESLARRGHHVKVLCCDHASPYRPYPVEAILFSNGENEDFDLAFNFPAFTTHPSSRETTFGNLTATRRRAYLRVFRQRINQEVALFGPDIVHVHHGWVIAFFMAELDVPYVVSLHGTEYLGYEKCPDYRELVLHGLHGAHFVIAQTESDREQAIRTYGLELNKVMVVRGGVDTKVFKPLQVNKERLLQGYEICESDRPIVFFGGKLTAIKGVDVLLQAACMYSQINERPLTLIAGDGDVREDLISLARELNLEDVHFLGHQSRQQMLHLFNIADVVVLPSKVESLPLVAMEALACGTPVVASDVGGFRQIVHEQVGSLVVPGAPGAFAEKIVAMIRQEFKKQAGCVAVDHIRRNFSWRNTVAGVESVYELCK